MNYWVMLSGSPTEPVAMATHSGSGPLWEGVQRTARQHHEKQQRVWALAFRVSGSSLCSDAFYPCPWLSPARSAVTERVQNSHTFQNGRRPPVFSSVLTPFCHAECLANPSSVMKRRASDGCSRHALLNLRAHFRCTSPCIRDTDPPHFLGLSHSHSVSSSYRDLSRARPVRRRPLSLQGRGRGPGAVPNGGGARAGQQR